MLTRRVIAANITNLTDARYFAARGVDYLMFDVSSLGLDKIIEIKEWVEGPDHILSFDDTTIDLLEEALLRISPSHVTSKDPGVIKSLQLYAAHAEVVTIIDGCIDLDVTHFKQIHQQEDLSTLEDAEGIIVSGDDEQEVGLKDYDLLDQILDALEENG